MRTKARRSGPARILMAFSLSIAITKASLITYPSIKRRRFAVLCNNFRMLTERALPLLHQWVQSDSLRRHCYAVADSMRHFAQLRGEDPDLWEAVGLLHDMDYERHPNLERSATEGH